MSGAVKAAIGILTGGAGSWIPLAIVAGVSFGAGIGGTWWVAHQRIVAVSAERDQAKQAADLAQEDAARWKSASDTRDRVIAERDAQLDAQNAAVEQLRASVDRADQAAAAAEAQTRDARAAFDQRTQELEDAAHAQPSDVRGLGPIVLKRVDRLFE
jgi:hypothetical protein